MRLCEPVRATGSGRGEEGGRVPHVGYGEGEEGGGVVWVGVGEVERVEQAEGTD